MAIDGSLFPSEKLSNVILMKNQKGLSDDLSDSTSQKAKKQGEMPLTIPFIKINVEFRDGISLVSGGWSSVCSLYGILS